MMRKKWILISMCLILIDVSFIATSYAESKVGFINLNRLVNESQMGKVARKNLKRLREGKTVALADKEKRFNELKSYINKNSDRLTPVETRKKMRELQTVSKEYKRLFADSKEEVAREDRELVATILNKANGALKKVAQKRRFNIILKDPNALGYLDPKVDITDDVLKELNRMR